MSLVFLLPIDLLTRNGSNTVSDWAGILVGFMKTLFTECIGHAVMEVGHTGEVTLVRPEVWGCCRVSWMCQLRNRTRVSALLVISFGCGCLSVNLETVLLELGCNKICCKNVIKASFGWLSLSVAVMFFVHQTTLCFFWDIFCEIFCTKQLM